MWCPTAASGVPMPAEYADSGWRAQRGYAAMAIMAILIVASLAAVVGQLDARQLRLRREQDAAAALESAKSALIAYAASYRDYRSRENFGHLPCPDAAGNGTEQSPCGTSGSVALGLLPVKSLGLPDLRDADGNCLWYAVSGSFKANPKTLPFNWDTQGQLSVREAKSGRLLAAPDDGNGGAAAVIIAPGPALANQRRDASSNCGAAQPGAYLENSGNVFETGIQVDGNGVSVANDRVVWITAKEIFDTVARRSDFAGYLNECIEAMRSMLGSQKARTGNVLPANPFGAQAFYYTFYDGWKDQFRYLHCPTASPGCFTDKAGGHHNALLLFSGRSTSGNPRTTAARTLPDYFESALGLAQGEKFATCTTDPANFDNASAAGRAADLALCLVP